LLDDVLFKLRRNASFIVFEDADIEMAVKGAIARNTASRNSSRSNTFAWAASTAKAGLPPHRGRPRLLRFARNDILGGHCEEPRGDEAISSSGVSRAPPKGDIEG